MQYTLFSHNLIPLLEKLAFLFLILETAMQ